VLVVGGGGREHALAWHLAGSGHQVFCAPGNAGITHVAQCEPISATDLPGLTQLARRQKIDLTIVGPEAPLVAGAADEFERQGLKVLGPRQSGARIEGDKAFAKEVMHAAGIPTARFQTFTDFDAARKYLVEHRLPVVVKASGLAAGKGVVVAETRPEAEQVVADMLREGRYGEAGKVVVIEEFLQGEEVSMIGLCDGRSVQVLAPSQDHKRLLDGDRGPNTGGMGAYAPAPVMTAALQLEVQQKVFVPLLAEFARRDIDYRGVIYAGMMLTADGPRVLEFNCRFGDPETQVILPLLAGDLAEFALHRAPRIEDWNYKANFAYRVGRQVEQPEHSEKEFAIDPAKVRDITAQLDRQGVCSYEELAALVAVSTMTVRRSSPKSF
jgi:phosphoribosylamine--glycine ligase